MRRRKRVSTVQDLPEHRERARRSSNKSVDCRPIIVISDSGKPEAEHVQKLPEGHLEQALDNAIVRGDFERVKMLVEHEGAKPREGHLKTALDMKEETIRKYLEAEIKKRRSGSRVSLPSEDGWDEL